jgi:hypothetical protein
MARIPNGDFIVYFQELLTLPLAGEYFPDLRVENGPGHTGGTGNLLESDDSTAGLMDFLDSSVREVEDTGVIQAAKLIYGVQNAPEHRQVQLATGVAHFKLKMAE